MVFCNVKKWVCVGNRINAKKCAVDKSKKAEYLLILYYQSNCAANWKPKKIDDEI